MSAREVAGPLNDIASDANALMDDYIGHDDLRQQAAADPGQRQHASASRLRQAAEGPNTRSWAPAT